VLSRRGEAAARHPHAVRKGARGGRGAGASQAGAAGHGGYSARHPSLLLDILGADEKKAVFLLQQHSLVTVDDTGCVAMYALTQRVVRDLTPKVQRPVLVAALAGVLASKLRKFNHQKPMTFFIRR